MSGPNTRRVNRFVRNKLAIVGFVLLVLLLLFSYLGPLVYHTEQVLTNIRDVRLGPGWAGIRSAPTTSATTCSAGSCWPARRPWSSGSPRVSSRP
ncbi:hypothetical protein GCM10029964_001620 [Kibdelosporangium lantanae]